MMSELEALGARIAAYRGSRSQKDLALETGLDVSTISRIERGITDSTYGTLRKICKALNVTWDALIRDAADKIVPDTVFKTSDGTSVAVEMKTLEAGSDPEVAASEAERVRQWIELSATAARWRGRTPDTSPADRPGEDFLDRPMSPEQASRLAALVKHEVEKCEQDSFEANAREFADVMGRVDWADTISVIALAQSRWVPRPTVLLGIAACIGMERELALPLLRLETEHGSLDAVLDAWEHEVVREQARLASPAVSKSPAKQSEQNSPLSAEEIEILRVMARLGRPASKVEIAENIRQHESLRKRKQLRPRTSS